MTAAQERRRNIRRTKYWLMIHLEDLYAACSLAVRGEPGQDVWEAWDRFLFSRRRWEAACRR